MQRYSDENNKRKSVINTTEHSGKLNNSKRINNHHTKQQHSLENKLKHVLQLDGMKMKFSQIYTMESTDFHNAWCGAIQNVLKQPQTKLTFGSNDYKKTALDSIQTIILTGTLSSQAIGQIENKQTHPQYKFGGKRLEEYCKEFTADAVNKWRDELS